MGHVQKLRQDNPVVGYTRRCSIDGVGYTRHCSIVEYTRRCCIDIFFLTKKQLRNASVSELTMCMRLVNYERRADAEILKATSLRHSGCAEISVLLMVIIPWTRQFGTSTQCFLLCVCSTA